MGQHSGKRQAAVRYVWLLHLAARAPASLIPTPVINLEAVPQILPVVQPKPVAVADCEGRWVHMAVAAVSKVSLKCLSIQRTRSPATAVTSRPCMLLYIVELCPHCTVGPQSRQA